jgi:hypothetical protein
MNMNSRNDLGIQTVRELFRLWQVDEEWAVWREDGFDWWPGDFRQRVRSDAGVDDHGALVFRVSAATDFLRGVDAKRPSTLAYLDMLSRFASGYAYVLDDAECTVRLVTVAYLHSGNARWLTGLLAGLAILQPIDAQIRAAGVANAAGAHPDRSAHPLRGQRQEPDDILHLIEDPIRPLGEGSSRWAGSREFEEIAKTIGRSANAFGAGGSTGLTLETPFGADTALLQLTTESRHPQLGNGLLSLCQLPFPASQADTTATVLHLNRLEASGFARAHLIGSWCTAEARSGYLPVFCSFLPNLLYQDGLATNLVLSNLARVQWIKSALPGLPADRRLDDILTGRLQGFDGGK